jgi:plasmid rolling circle replication initiator protein Rep
MMCYRKLYLCLKIQRQMLNAIILEQTQVDWMISQCKRVEELSKTVNTLLTRPELQQWVTIKQICDQGLLGGRTKSFKAAKKVLIEAIATKKIRVNTLNNTYNLNDLLLFRGEFEY